MVEIKGTVTTTDGTAHEFVGGPWAWSQWERYAQRNGLDTSPEKSPMTWSLFVAYASLHQATWERTDRPGYEKWSASVAAVDLDVEDARPTPPAASDG